MTENQNLVLRLICSWAVSAVVLTAIFTLATKGVVAALLIHMGVQ